MNFFRRLKGFTMRFTRGSGSSAWSSFFSAARDLVYTGDGADSSVVTAPLQWIMRTFPEAPCVVERKQGTAWEIEEEHLLTTLLATPNPFYSGDLLWRATVMDMVLDGNAYWAKVQDGVLRVNELWWIPNELIEPKWDQDGRNFITHYEYRPGGDVVRLKPEQVVHFRWDLDPDNNRLGRSPLKAVLREVFADDEAARFAAALLKNMGVPGLVVAPDGDYAISDDDMLATKAAIEARTTGDQRGRPFVAGAPTKIAQFGFNPQQMDMRTLRRVPEERVTAALGVPAIVAGLGAGLDRSTFANFAEAREMAYESCIIPLQRLVAADLRTQLLPDFEANTAVVRITFDLTEVRVLQEDENAKTERKLKELGAGAITLAEYRRETGREADKNMEVYLRNFNVTEVRAEDVGKEPEPEEPPIIDADPLPALPPVAEEDPEEEQKRRQWTWKLRTKSLQEDLINEFERRGPLLSALLERKLREVFVDLGAAAEEAFDLHKNRKADEDVEQLVLKIIMSMRRDLARADDQFQELIKRHYTRTTDDTVEVINKVFDLNVNLPDHEARAIVAQGGTRAGLVDLTEDTKTALFRALEAGRAAGEGPAQLARRIRAEVPKGRFTNAGSQYRAELIARTETKYAQNISAMSAYKEAGATRLLAFDGRGKDPDPKCLARNGQEFSLEAAHRELADEHPNGTLSFAPIFTP